jgi:miniconductance mechanosensitive channel
MNDILAKYSAEFALFIGLEQGSILMAFINTFFLIAMAFFIFLLLKSSVVRLIRDVIVKVRWGFGTYLIKHKLFTSILLFLPISLIITGHEIIGNDVIELVIKTIMRIAMIVLSGNLMFTTLNAAYDILKHKGLTRKIPFKAIFQIIKIATTLVCLIVIISYLVGKSPAYLLGSLGALSAVLMLVFRDVFIGLVSGIQLAVNRMVSVGDWVEIDGANGEVTDISLTTVHIENWDKTTSTLPCSSLVSNPMKNWKTMYNSGRRIKRSINIDSNTVSFISKEEMVKLSKIYQITDYMNIKSTELDKQNSNISLDEINMRKLTNIGCFRVFLENFLRSHSEIKQDATLIVRQLAPSDRGIPIEIYCFSVNTDWVEYERLQSDLFDYIIAVLPLFKLSHHQMPSGRDLDRLNIS